MNVFSRLKVVASLLWAVCVFACLPYQLAAQEPLKNGTTAASFLELAVDTRGVALGDAYVATAEGPAGVWWNPGGLGMMTDIEVSFMQMNYVADIDMQNLALAIPIPGAVSLGVMITNLGVPEDKIRTVEDPEGLSGESFDASSVALGFYVARKFTERFSIGLGGKFINEKLHQETANAFALDFGVLIRTNFLNNTTLGMSITNFGSKLRFTGEDLFRQIADRDDIAGTNQNLPANFETDSWPLPITFRLGVATSIFERGGQKLRVSIDALHPNNTSEYVNVGGEYTTRVGRLGQFALRGGYNTAFQDDSQQGLTLGSGIDIFVNPNFSLGIDYAYADYEFFGDIHRYSVSFKF